MGPGDQATAAHINTAYALGNAIARAGWVLLTGGRNVGVMDAACRGARAAQGLTLGILPASHIEAMSGAVDIPIVTGLGNARNPINILTSHVVVACGQGPGTASEIALAFKTETPVVLMETDAIALAFWQSLSPRPLNVAPTVEQAIQKITELLPRVTPPGF